VVLVDERLDAFDRRPDAVSSNFSVTDTKATPRLRSVARTAKWSAASREKRSSLWTTTVSAPS